MTTLARRRSTRALNRERQRDRVVVVFVARYRYRRRRISSTLCCVVAFSCDVAAHVAVCMTTCDNTNHAAAGCANCTIVSGQSRWRGLNTKNFKTPANLLDCFHKNIFFFYKIYSIASLFFYLQNLHDCLTDF